VTLVVATATAVCLSWAGPGFYPGPTTVSNLVGVAIMGAGMAIRTDPLQRYTGNVLIATGIAWTAMNMLYVRVGPLSFLGELLVPAGPLMLAWAIWLRRLQIRVLASSA
jgi:hypothetical protein